MMSVNEWTAAVAWGAGEALVMEEVKVDPPQRLEVRLRILFTSICHTDLSAWKGEVLFIFSIISFLLLLLLLLLISDVFCLERGSTSIPSNPWSWGGRVSRIIYLVDLIYCLLPNILIKQWTLLDGNTNYRIVESVGEGVEEMKAGDHVLPIFTGECGECRVCNRDGANLCERFRVDPMKKVMVSDGKTRFFTSKDNKPIFHFLNTSTFSEYTVIDSACVVKVDPLFPLEKMSLLSCGVSTGN